MHRKIIHISPTAHSWEHIAIALLKQYPQGLEEVRIVVPTAVHAELIRKNLQRITGKSIRAAGISTLDSWIASYEPAKDIGKPMSENRRLLTLYAELRNYDWLKKLFSVRSNPDMFPLAETLLSLSNELTEALLPGMSSDSHQAEDRWEAALAQLSPQVRDMLSNEAQLVWEIWKTQLDNRDAQSVHFAQLLRLAEDPINQLVWISSALPTPMEEHFFEVYSHLKPVTQVTLGWVSTSVPRLYAHTWPEMIDGPMDDFKGDVETPKNISIVAARSLEDEAQQGAQTIVQWLESGKRNLAIVAQDRIVSRRIRALLERAHVYVADETGWKLSTTRAAAGVIALLDLVLAKAKSRALLDLLKCSFIFADLGDKMEHVMAIEAVIRKENLKGGWLSIKNALVGLPTGASIIDVLQENTADLAAYGQKTMAQWIDQTKKSMDQLGMVQYMATDAAGEQILALFDQLAETFSASAERFSLPEWKTFLSMQLEAAAFIAPGTDTRVVMLPLNGARLRSFDAILVAGTDANHLPSQVSETMFFANAVRRELGLVTREVLQRQQMRDFSEVLLSGAEVVLSYQKVKDGDVVAVSPWIERLQLTLECAGLDPIPSHEVKLNQKQLVRIHTEQPAPSAGELMPSMMSPSAYNCMVSCPYQYFATHMLGLKSLKDLTDVAEKRNYGTWLHEILNTYQTVIRDTTVPVNDRSELLATITESVFKRELALNPAALSYYSRWKKVMPVYIQWSQEREANGWKFLMGEQKLRRTLSFEGGTITLEGYVDRIDVNDSSEEGILDYKSSTYIALSAKVKEKEDQQLPFYGLLRDRQPREGAFVSLDMQETKKAAVSAPDYDKWMLSLENQIVGNVIAIKSGNPMPANGTGTACDYCVDKGLCRKNAWQA